MTVFAVILIFELILLSVFVHLSLMDHYQVLGVDKYADITEINKKYRELTKKNHPDRHMTESLEKQHQYHALFITINKAYEILSDEDKRREYDQSLLLMCNSNKESFIYDGYSYKKNHQVKYRIFNEKTQYTFDNIHIIINSHFQFLVTIDCSDNDIHVLPNLPPKLVYLKCDRNNLVKLPECPNTLVELYCRINQLQYLPEMPLKLQRLYCCNNELMNLPKMPPRMIDLDCSYNYIAECYIVLLLKNTHVSNYLDTSHN